MNNSRSKLKEAANFVGQEPQMTIQAYYQLRLAYNLLNKTGGADIEKLGIKVAYYGVLYALKDGKEISPSELGQKVVSGLSNLTSLIDRMEGVGLVTRTNDKKDRRKKLLKLTKAGELISQKVVAPHLEWIMKTMGVFSENELKEFCHLLEILWKEVFKQAEEG